MRTARWYAKQFFLVAFAYVAWGLVDQGAHPSRRLALENAGALLNVEHALGFDRVEQLVRLLPPPGTWATAAYIVLHWLGTLAVAVYLMVRRRELWRRARWALGLVVLAGVLFEVYLPVAPPWMMGKAPEPSWAVALSAHGSKLTTDLTAAFPSLHVAFAVWVALAMVRAGWSRLWWLYPAAITWLVLATGNHYLGDALAGALLAVGCWRLEVPRPSAATVKRVPVLPASVEVAA